MRSRFGVTNEFAADAIAVGHDELIGICMQETGAD
jgi:hypothetical protein